MNRFFRVSSPWCFLITEVLAGWGLWYLVGGWPSFHREPRLLKRELQGRRNSWSFEYVKVMLGRASGKTSLLLIDLIRFDWVIDWLILINRSNIWNRWMLTWSTWGLPLDSLNFYSTWFLLTNICRHGEVFFWSLGSENSAWRMLVFSAKTPLPSVVFEATDCCLLTWGDHVAISFQLFEWVWFFCSPDQTVLSRSNWIHFPVLLGTYINCLIVWEIDCT